MTRNRVDLSRPKLTYVRFVKVCFAPLTFSWTDDKPDETFWRRAAAQEGEAA